MLSAEIVKICVCLENYQVISCAAFWVSPRKIMQHVKVVSNTIHTFYAMCEWYCHYCHSPPLILVEIGMSLIYDRAV